MRLSRTSGLPADGFDDHSPTFDLLTHTGEIAGTRMSLHPQRDQLLVARQHTQALSGRPEHAVGITEGPTLGTSADRYELYLVDAGMIRQVSTYWNLNADGTVTTGDHCT